jgi:hypothetical protein
MYVVHDVDALHATIAKSLGAMCDSSGHMA